MWRARNNNKNRMRHEGVDRETLKRKRRLCKKTKKVINTAKDLGHTELRTLMMVMMMAMAVKMNRSG